MDVGSVKDLVRRVAHRDPEFETALARYGVLSEDERHIEDLDLDTSATLREVVDSLTSMIHDCSPQFMAAVGELICKAHEEHVTREVMLKMLANGFARQLRAFGTNLIWDEQTLQDSLENLEYLENDVENGLALLVSFQTQHAVYDRAKDAADEMCAADAAFATQCDKIREVIKRHNRVTHRKWTMG
jgi:hypothetical protein